MNQADNLQQNCGVEMFQSVDGLSAGYSWPAEVNSLAGTWTLIDRPSANMFPFLAGPR